MTTLFAKHEVKDYAAWRRVYDDFDAKRRKMGVISDSVYRSEDDPNNITVTHDFSDLAAAKAFADSQELRDTMHKAGVTGAPEIWFAKDV
jgi:quinol monooxygenase YgiN